MLVRLVLVKKCYYLPLKCGVKKDNGHLKNDNLGILEELPYRRKQRNV